MRSKELILSTVFSGTKECNMCPHTFCLFIPPYGLCDDGPDLGRAVN